ncbi:Uncharacterized protein BP5553_03725 [Venustampulla echinocandica]|uniref:Uncharacterized protein n=1 Tax=Venustampulla echinocandica TaxID=2656787 RepID=A0A370TV20_9HELO|nr:Uncharacterized protein BP5553_03725 [Venustampulla echinocandica]RDL39385.1 Uncharacterized protein BP5553_03725 [Venustampulla echinocandica]
MGGTETPARKTTASLSPSGASIRRASTFDDSTPEFQRRPLGNRLSTNPDVHRSSSSRRRRSSNFSEYSLNEARKSFQSSTDELLLPKPRTADRELGHDSSPWDSVPLAFALLPAIGGMLFTNGSLVITDIILLGLAAIFLNWSVRLPWDWYHSAQAIRAKETGIEDQIFHEESDDDDPSFAHADSDEVPKAETTEAPESSQKPVPPSPAHEAARRELYRHELLALLSCFLFPVLGAYLLHTLRSQLSRPSEGLVSNYNLTIFLLASELRPMAHLVRLIQSRTLHLQRVVASNPHSSTIGRANNAPDDIIRRLEELEARISADEPSPPSEPVLNNKQTAILVTEVLKKLQPELDALNRAVRRYEKRATLHAFQIESRLLDLDARLGDAISLAAAAANNGNRNRKFTTVVVEWAATAVMLPFQALTSAASLPFKAIGVFIKFARPKIASHNSDNTSKNTNGKYTSYGRTGDGPRSQGRMMKKQ